MESSEAILFKRRVMPVVPVMETLARRLLPDEADVRDALQEALMRLWRHRDTLDDVTNVRAYCLSVIRNAAVDRLGYAAEAAPLEYAGDFAAPTDRYDDLTEAETMLAQLPDRQQKAIRMRSFRDMEVNEIAVEMNISEANVRQLLSRGRRRLKQLISLCK